MVRYITARGVCDGRAWQYCVPDYVGKVKVGDIVVVGDTRCGEVGLALVESIDLCAKHQSDNIWPIIDKVKMKRWKKLVRKIHMRSELLTEMSRRQVELSKINAFNSYAEEDKMMRDLLRKYNSLG